MSAAPKLAVAPRAKPLSLQLARVDLRLSPTEAFVLASMLEGRPYWAETADETEAMTSLIELGAVDYESGEVTELGHSLHEAAQ